MTPRIISGNRTAREVLKSYLENPPAPSPQGGQPLGANPSAGNSLLHATSTTDFYTFDRAAIHQATTPAYRTFLKDAGYADLDSCSGIAIAKNVLKYTQEVRNKGVNGTDGTYVVNITHTDGKNLIEILGGRLLTIALMYSLFIPYIKNQAQTRNAEAQATLKEMTDTKAEWLEDIVLNQNTLKIGRSERALNFPKTDAFFDRGDLNEFGYPTTVKNTGEFRYWYPRENTRAAIRDGNSVLGLGLGRGPSYALGVLGVRLAKIFP